jgi:signal transduction histidine kinase
MNCLTLNKLLTLYFFAAFALINTGQTALAEQSNRLLTNAIEVLSLSAEQASLGVKISIRGVVTAAEPNWGGRFFVQDSSGGVFVENISNVQPSPGDMITVSGISFPGGYAPIISQPHWKITGTAPLPAPKSVAIGQLMSGAEDSQRIEISGIVRSAQIINGELETALVSGGYRIHVYAPIPSNIDPQALVGARVQIKGTAATFYNAQLRRLVSVDVYVPFLSDFVIEKPATTNPFGEPLTPISNIGQYHIGRAPGNQIHVKGVVTYQRNGKDVFIRDTTGGLQIKSSQMLSLSPGDVIEAVGFPGIEDFLPVLEDAVLKKTPEHQPDVMPESVSIGELVEGLHHADFITLNGKLLDRLIEKIPSSAGESDIKKITLVLQTTNVVFTAEAETAQPNSLLESAPVGSSVNVSGVCFLQSEEDGKIKSFQILLPTSNSIRVITKPSWFTPQHLLIILALALAVIVAASSWIIMVLKRNSALRYLIHERELDQKELQKAHDTLDWRVKERTQQLKFQITARKEAEVQFKAILTERTRLAKELHDTLAQTLTGITLQLNTVAMLFEQNPAAANYHLGLSRNMMRMSQVDLRRSIWDLRSRELEEFDLSMALLISVNQIADSGSIHAEVETKGNVRPLPEVIEENLLRIAQEAVTNTVKHSGANWVRIELAFNVQNVTLEVKDDGRGFNPENCVGPNDGHFGLLGISERAKRLGGQISITSAPDNGTTIRVEFPIEQIQIQKLVCEPINHEESINNPDSSC